VPADGGAPPAEWLDSLKGRAVGAATTFVTQRLSALLLAAGVPGVLVSVGMWWFHRRAVKRLRARIDSFGTIQAGTAVVADPANDAHTTVNISSHMDPKTRTMRFNRYVEVPDNRLDKAWADAHAILAEQNPNYRKALVEAEGMKNELLKGIIPNFTKE
jgi:hypothetical protein